MKINISKKTKDKILFDILWVTCALTFLGIIYVISDVMIQNPDPITFEINGTIIQSELITDANRDHYTYITMQNGSTYLIHDWHTFILNTPITLNVKECYFTDKYVFIENWEVVE